MSQMSRIGPKIEVDPSIPVHESLAHMLFAAVDSAPDTTAVIYEQRSITYREFGRAVNGLAARLRELGVADRPIVIMSPNTIEMDVALIAVMSLGCQVAPVNPFFTAAELAKIIGKTGAGLIICDPTVQAKAEAAAATLGIQHVLALGEGATTIEPWIAEPALDFLPDELPRADDLALLIFTGGSTGIPKGVDHTHRGLMWSLLQHCSVWPVEPAAEVFLNVAPMFHIFGLAYSAWVPIYCASTLVMIPKYDPDKVVAALGEHRVTVFAGGPAPIYMGLLGSPLFDATDFSALRYCLSGGAPCPEDLHRIWLEKTGQPLLEGWGMTEGAPFCLNRFDGERKMLSVGNPVPATEVEVVDLETGETVLPMGEAGEVRVRGPQLMLRYRDSAEETAQTMRHGFVYTGDIGYTDADGFLFLVDRKKDMVLVGGYNVYPREVDELLFNHPKIREAAAVGKPDPRLGEVVVAYVALEAGEELSEDEFFAYCKEHLVKYKRPVEVYFIDALPRTGTNKINRIELRDRLKARVGGERAWR
jgi:long-chain acyl-CoA synthetase